MDRGRWRLPYKPCHLGELLTGSRAPSPKAQLSLISIFDPKVNLSPKQRNNWPHPPTSDIPGSGPTVASEGRTKGWPPLLTGQSTEAKRFEGTSLPSKAPLPTRAEWERPSQMGRLRLREVKEFSKSPTASL